MADYTDKLTLAAWNALIDGTVPCKKLTDITTTEDASNLSLDLTGNTWGDHSFIFLKLTPNGGSYTSSVLRVNGNNGSGSHSRLTDITSQSAELAYFYWSCGLQMLLFNNRGLSSPICGFAASEGPLQYVQLKHLSRFVTSLDFGVATGTNYCRAGSRLEIWGIF